LPAEIAISDSAQGSEATEPSLAAEADRRADLRASIPGAHKRGESKLPIDPTADSPSGEIAGSDQTDEQIADAADADLDAPPGTPKRAPTSSTDETQRRIPSPSDVTRRVKAPQPADSGLPFDTVTLAGIAVAVLIVLVLAVRIFRRRSIPNDLDVTTFADEPDDDTAALDRETSDRIPAEGFSMNDSPTDGPAPQVEEQNTDGPAAPQVEEQNTAAYSLSEVAAEAIEPETGLYDEDSEGEKPMDMETSNLPTERDDFGAPPAAVMSGSDDNMSELVQELAGRIANLETRLDEANDSRERLERQVAAQSEELRVQRAAIARTQRALRSLSRSEEDQATEPALREPSQPAG
jgi:anti-sigma-K factor RskA